MPIAPISRERRKVQRIKRFHERAFNSGAQRRRNSRGLAGWINSCSCRQRLLEKEQVVALADGNFVTTWPEKVDQGNGSFVTVDA